jgi:lysine-specific demethylase 3
VNTPLLPVDQSSIGPYAVPPGKQIQLQDGRCLKPEYKKAKQCGACVKREAGKACLFSGFRAFLLNPGAGWFATEDTPYFFASSSLPSQSFSFNSTFNRPITDQDKDDIRRTAAQALLPAMEQELAHARRSNAVRRPLDYTSRNVCDFCLANFFIGSFFCGGCGKEFCFECMEVIQGYLPGKGKPVHPSRPEDAGSDAYDPINQYHRPEENEVVYSNTGRIKREPGSASPAPGGPRAMSAAALADIAALPPSVQVKNGKIVAHNIKRLLTCSHNRLHGMDDMVAVTSSTEQDLERFVRGMSMYDNLSPPPKRDPYTLPAGLPAKYPTDSLPYLIIDEADLTPEVFDKVWSQGQTVVISGLEDRFKIDWSPQSFAEAFARMKCSVEDAQLGRLESLRLGDFFANFGNDYLKRGATWKLKVAVSKRLI